VEKTFNGVVGSRSNWNTQARCKEMFAAVVLHHLRDAGLLPFTPAAWERLKQFPTEGLQHARLWMLQARAAACAAAPGSSAAQSRRSPIVRRVSSSTSFLRATRPWDSSRT